MKKFFVIVTVFSVVFSSSALAQVSESLEWATRIKAEGLSRPSASYPAIFNSLLPAYSVESLRRCLDLFFCRCPAK